MRLNFIIAGMGLLLISAFIDSSRGPLLPVLSHELGLAYEQVSWFLVVGYLSSMTLGRMLIPLVDRYGVKRVCLVLCGLVPLTALFAQVVSGLGTLIVFGALVACSSASIGALSNLFVLNGTDPAYRARFYGLLHAMYGLGSQLAPIVIGVFLARAWQWQGLFVLVCFPVLIVMWIVFRLPGHVREHHPNAVLPARFRWISIQGLLVVAFGIYVGAEVLGSMWMTTYLVEVRQFTVEDATPYATGFFLSMTLTRLACFLVREDAQERRIIWGCLLMGLAAFLLGLFVHPVGFALTGLVGPFFPLVLARMSRYFPKEAPALTLRILLIVQGALAICHFGMGWIATHFGVAVAYQVPAFAYVVALASISLYFRQERRYLPNVSF